MKQVEIPQVFARYVGDVMSLWEVMDHALVKRVGVTTHAVQCLKLPCLLFVLPSSFQFIYVMVNQRRGVPLL
jgi:hypothetical protein